MYVNSRKIDTVTNFKYLGFQISSTSTKPDTIILARLASAKRVFNAI
jgi:hypothetical protein